MKKEKFTAEYVWIKTISQMVVIYSIEKYKIDNKNEGLVCRSYNHLFIDPLNIY